MQSETKYKTSQLRCDCWNEEEISRKEGEQVLQKQYIKEAEDIARDNDDLDTTDYMMTENSYMIPVIFHNLKGYDLHLIIQYAPNSNNVRPTSS